MYLWVSLEAGSGVLCLEQEIAVLQPLVFSPKTEVAHVLEDQTYPLKHDIPLSLSS